jgi:hypothetical protein
MNAIVLLGPTAVLAVWMRLGFREALVYVGVPCLLLFPAYYQLELSGLPEVNFWNFTFAALLGTLVLSAERRLLQLRGLDLLVVSLVAWTVASEFDNKGFADARKVLANQVMGVMAPYVLGRVAASHNGLLVGFLAAIALLGAGVGLISPYEARFGSNPFDFWRSLWPTSVPWDGALYRFGLRRVAGPFAHPICHGFFFSMTLPLVFWLRDRRLMPGIVGRWGLPAAHVLGLMAAGSRGPWLGAAIGLGVMASGWFRSRALVAAAIVSGGILVAPVATEVFSSYVNVSRGEARTETQETAAYRRELLENYLEVITERPWMGFGRNEIPVVKGQKSIDNQYLFLALVHGLPAAALFLAVLVLPALALITTLLRAPPQDPLARLGWAVAGVLIGSIVTQATVTAGVQTEQVLLLLIGAAVELERRVRREPQHSLHSSIEYKTQGAST